ncbi:MAG: hypothetical protein MJZ72_02920 [Bacteroidales bacterium]|nr:hypothetical protein [Bacteroidales bacterium]
MKRILLFAIAVAMVMTFGSCHKEGKYTPSKKISRIYEESSSDGRHLSQSWNWNKNKLQSINHHNYDGSIYFTEDFTYKNGRISRIDLRFPDSYSSDYFEITYDGGKLSRITEYYDGRLSNESSFTYKNGKISTMNETYYSKHYKDEAMPTVKSTFLSLIIPELSDRIVENLYRLSNKSGSDFFTYSFEWKGNNISMIKCSYDEGGTETKFTYDNKKNPFYGLLDDGSPSLEAVSSKNNVTSYTDYYYNYDGETSIGTCTYTYTYDGNWPTSERYQVNHQFSFGIYYTSYGTTYYEYVK